MSRLAMADRPLSFCMVTTFYPPYHFGGEAMYIYRLSNELAERGHRGHRRPLRRRVPDADEGAAAR